MKKMIVDRTSHPATFKKCKSLGHLVTCLEKDGENNKYFITHISLNGKSMDQDEEGLLENLSIDEVEFLEVQMSSVQEIIKNMIAENIKLIQDIQLRSIRFSKEFRADKNVDEEKVKFVLIQCRSLIENLEEVYLAHQSERFNIRHLPLWHQAETELSNIIQAILQSRKLPDPDFVSDLIEYDLVHALDQWEEVFEKELIDNSDFSGIFQLKSTKDKSDNGADA